MFNLYADNKIQKNFGDVYCPKCKNEKCFTISNNEASSFYDSKKCRARCDVFNIPFKE